MLWVQQPLQLLQLGSMATTTPSQQQAIASAAFTGLYAAAVINLTPMMVEPANAIVEQQQQQAVPVLEVIKVYGRLAGSECYGMKAPKGSSCQITSNDIDRIFQLSSSSGNNDNNDYKISEIEFGDKLTNTEFQWPLKPYGIDKSKSLTKTATMNKGAETKIYMDLLEERGLYDKRNPTGPLPSSLRPELNKQLQQESIDSITLHTIYETLRSGNVSGSKSKTNSGDQKLLKASQIRKTLLETQTGEAMDYYGFLDLIGKETITWPY